MSSSVSVQLTEGSGTIVGKVHSRLHERLSSLSQFLWCTRCRGDGRGPTEASRHSSASILTTPRPQASNMVTYTWPSSLTNACIGSLALVGFCPLSVSGVDLRA